MKGLRGGRSRRKGKKKKNDERTYPIRYQDYHRAVINKQCGIGSQIKTDKSEKLILSNLLFLKYSFCAHVDRIL